MRRTGIYGRRQRKVFSREICLDAAFSGQWLFYGGCGEYSISGTVFYGNHGDSLEKRKGVQVRHLSRRVRAKDGSHRTVHPSGKVCVKSASAGKPGKCAECPAQRENEPEDTRRDRVQGRIYIDTWREYTVAGENELRRRRMGDERGRA